MNTALGRRIVVVIVLSLALARSGFGATAETDYTDASAVDVLTQDHLGTGHVTATASADKAGSLKTMASVSSNFPIGFVALNQGLGGNQAKGISLVRNYYQVTSSSEVSVSVTANVSNLVTPTAHWDRESDVNQIVGDIGSGLDSVCGGNPIMPRSCGYNPYLGSFASSYLTLGLHAYFTNDPESGMSDFRFLMPDAAPNGAQPLISGPQVLAGTLSGVGLLVVTVQLEAAALASGSASSAAASCELKVEQMSVAPAVRTNASG